MDASTRGLIEALHAAPWQCVLALTGGGTSAAADLLAVPGGSRTILEVVVPYHAEALAEYLGHVPEQACSAATSQQMAGRAFERALWLAPDQPVLGLGATASLASDRPKRGDHRAHVSCGSALQLRTWSITLQKGARDRAGEEELVNKLILHALSAGFGLTAAPALPLLGEERLEEQCESCGPIARLFAGTTRAVCVEPDGRVRAAEDSTPPLAEALLPGAFNPLHHGHWGLAEAAERRLGKPVAFELSVVNVDKAPLSPEEVRRRVAQFSGRATVWLTRAPTFVEKARLFPGVVFAVGADTAERIVAPRYYAGAAPEMLEALAFLRMQGCRFLVAGRLTPGGGYLGLDDVPVPAEQRDLFTAIPQSEFHAPVSSTEIRAPKASGQSQAADS
jgi:Cytidylyltransferase-like